MTRYLPEGAKVGEYPSCIIHAATLDRLSVVAHLHDTPYAHPQNCKVLEIGCSTGGHIINMAVAHPNSTFVGIDINEEELNIAKAKSQGIGLNNLELLCLDAITWETDIRFDYIIIHGVVSWIESDIAKQMIEHAQSLLSDKGLLYISHLCWPKDFIQEIIRECFWLQYDPELDDDENVMNGKNIAKMVLEAWKWQKNPMLKHLQEQLNFLDRVPSSYIFHEYVCPRKTFRVHELLELMPSLQYVSDADMTPSSNIFEMESELLRNMWPMLSQDKLVRLCDSMYFIGFRSSIFTKAKCSPKYNIKRWKDLYMTRSLTQKPTGVLWFDEALDQRHWQLKVSSIKWELDTHLKLIRSLKARFLLFSTYAKEGEVWMKTAQAWLKSIEGSFALFYSGKSEYPLADAFGQEVQMNLSQARWLYWSMVDPAKRKTKMQNEILLNKFKEYQNLSFFEAKKLAEDMEKIFAPMFAKVGYKV